MRRGVLGLCRAVMIAAGISCAGSGSPRPRGVTDTGGGWISAQTLPRAGASEGRAATPAVPLESCGDTPEGFDGWLESFRRQVVEEGLSPETVSSALGGVAYDPEVVELDRSQRAFALSFEEFSAKRVTPARIAKGKELLRTHAALLAKIEERFGVAPRVLVAIWGLETDFGENVGSRSCMRALATLAYDCRRHARFRDELRSALRIVARGDLAPSTMVGAWAGELGQTQFLPSSYERFAVDFDGDGRVDLIRSSADALASTASYLEAHGWRARGEFGPGSGNFAVLREWNASEIYRRTIVLFATKLGKSRQ